MVGIGWFLGDGVRFLSLGINKINFVFFWSFFLVYFYFLVGGWVGMDGMDGMDGWMDWDGLEKWTERNGIYS